MDLHGTPDMLLLSEQPGVGFPGPKKDRMQHIKVSRLYAKKESASFGLLLHRGEILSPSPYPRNQRDEIYQNMGSKMILNERWAIKYTRVGKEGTIKSYSNPKIQSYYKVPSSRTSLTDLSYRLVQTEPV